MTKPSGYLTGASIALGLLCAPAAAKFVTFQPPGATITTPKVIANSGEVIGYFVDQSGVTHGFLRAPDGTFTTMDVPGATTTVPLAINDSGTIVGTYTVEAERRPLYTQGFIRSPDGQITEFQAPHAGRDTNAVSITNTGWIAGWGYRGSNTNTDFGFLRNPSGHFTKFGHLLAVRCANSTRTTAGAVLDGSGMLHGFARTPDGTMTQFDPDGATYTDVTGVNDLGTIAGYSQVDFTHYEGYVRAADGTISAFSGSQDATDTYAFGINKSGAIAGSYENKDGSGHGFVRAPDGTITTVDVPGASFAGPTSINNKGQVTGTVELNGVQMGFIGKP